MKKQTRRSNTSKKRRIPHTEIRAKKSTRQKKPRPEKEIRYSDIADRILSLVGSENYNALSAAEILLQFEDDTALAAQYGDTLPAAFFDTVDTLQSRHMIGLSKRGNLIAGAVLGYLSGTFHANAKGYGFLTPDNAERGDGDFFINPSATMGAMDGDKVTAHITKKNDPRDAARAGEAEILRIDERAVTSLTGTLCAEPSHRRGAPPTYFVAPDSTRISLRVVIPADGRGGAKEHDKVRVTMTHYPVPGADYARGIVEEIFGDCESKGANYRAILSQRGVRTEFPEEVLEEAQAVSAAPILPDGRLDLRDRMIFTIDGAGAKDLDDAISLERLEDGWLLGVHIADVGEYVKSKSKIDEEAFLRGTSIYFTDKVVPMLPEALSNGCCSLNGGIDRYALSALMTLDENGNIKECSLHESIINSKVRGVYEELNDVIERKEKSSFYDKYSMLFPDTFPDMLELYSILEAKGIRKGALDLESGEAEILLDTDGNVTDILLRSRGVCEKLIEQFMLCANEAVANYLYRMQMPCVYRIHEEPPEEKLEQFKQFSYHIGLDIKPLNAKTIRPLAMQTVMNEAKEKGLGGVLSTVMLRSLSKARYSDVPSQHFGLATDYYCHFTSPIRRYPDLTTHRFIKNILHGKADEAGVASMQKFAAKSAVQSSECELNAMYAERDIEDLYKVLFMQAHIGESFDGIVSSVTSFGFFVDFYNTCEGLVSIQSLPGYWKFDETKHTLSFGQKAYHLGDRIRVTLVRADIVTRKMDLEITDGSQG